MADIVIRRCTMRVTRHGGWSWGADRRALVDQVTRLLPQLIAARLANLLGEADGEIVAPLRLRVALGRAPFASPERLSAAIDAAITPESLPAAIRAMAPPAGARRPPAAIIQPAQPALAGPRMPAPVAVPSIRDLLLRWHRQGDLPQRLRGFSEAAASLWLAALLRECRSVSAGVPGAEELLRELRAIRARRPVAAMASGRMAHVRLVAGVELAARQPKLPDGELVLELLDRILPLTRISLDTPAPDLPRPDKRPPPPSPERQEATATAGLVGHDPAPARGTRRAATGKADVALRSVLPFLALGMLARVGWVDAAAATFQSLALPDCGAVFAAALAGKLLPPAERGWHRSASTLDTIAVFAGLETAPSPVAFEAWSRAAGSGLSALDSFVAYEIASGHQATLPLLVTRAGEVPEEPWLLFDADGFYPVALASDEDALLAALQAFRASIVLVGASAATPRLMRDLGAGQFAFATDAPPARGEDWTRLPGTPARWASPGDVPLPRVAAAARRLAELEAAAVATCREMLVLRRLALPDGSAALDQSAALAAAMGLGLLAWSLWREREAIDPLLALRRLGDLDGSARLMTDAIEVRPAVGRRYVDLKAHDLLRDIPGVPWLGGRTVRFVGP